MIELEEDRPRGRAASGRHAIHCDHAFLAEAARELERVLGDLAAAPPEPAAAEEAGRRLAWFALRLAEHFATEERSGILERAAAAEPRFTRRVARLRGEHDRLRRDMDDLAVGSDEPDWTRVHVRFVAFRRRLREHERAEEDVMLRAYLEDLGGGD